MFYSYTHMATVGVKGLNQPSVGSCYCETEVLTRSSLHRMLYSCTHMVTVGVKGLNAQEELSYNYYQFHPQVVTFTVRLLQMN